MKRKPFIFAEQRGESRHVSRQNRTYLKSLVTGDTTTFEEGPVTMLNESVNGALLQTPRPFYAGDILEVYSRESGEKPITNVFEVRWSQPLKQEAESHNFVIGCHLLFSTEWIETFTPSAPTAKPTPKIAA
jgi:hypothetical protein